MLFKSPHPDIAIPDIVVHRFVLARATALGDKPALIDAASGRTLTYGQLAGGADRVAAGLAARGFAPGDVLALFAPNCPEFALAFHGTLAAGGVVTTINSLSTVQDATYQLRDARARFLVTVPSFMDRAAPVAQQVGIEEIFVLGSAPGATPFATLLETGAAPLEADLETACARRLGCGFIQGYGLTEASPVTHANSDEPGKCKPGTVGPLVPNTECRIVDAATGADLGPDEDGELLIRGPQVMAGYLNNPEATAATLDAAGWLHTGDIGRVDRDGYFTIVDRLKELIKYKGFQVPPAELEALLRSHPAVADAAVVPLADRECGEVPKAFVVLRGDVSAADLMAYVAERVAPYKRIRALEVIDAIPKSPSGKILRRVLKERGQTVRV